MGCSPACPSGWAPDPARAGRIAELSAVDAPICFGESESGVRPDGLMLLDRRWSDPALAARAAHLALHEPLQPGPDCLQRAIAQEGRARMAELELRRSLGVSEPALAWAHLESAGAIEDWLTRLPDPAVDGYRARCED